MARNEWYHWFTSPYLQALYGTVSYPGREQFLSRLMDRLKPAPGSLLLEAGCGWGETAKLIAGFGFDTTGTDLSAISIERAKKMETETLHFYLHDLRLPFWSNFYDVAFNLYANFGFFDTQRENANALRTIAGSLKPGGVFVLDYFNTPYYERYPVTDDQQLVEGVTYNMSRWNDEDFFHSTILVNDPARNEPIQFTQKKAKYTAEGLTSMLALQGLKTESVFGDYELNAYDVNTSPRVIILARKVSEDAGDGDKRLYSDGRATDALT